MQATGYELSRLWFDYCFENPEKISPYHSALMFFILEHCNRLGWKEKVGLPTTMAMEAIGFKSYKIYIRTLRELIDWGFISLIQKSKNQYSANIIALVVRTKAPTKALSKAILKHTSKQNQSTAQSNTSIVKPLTSNLKPLTILRDESEKIFSAYPKQASKAPAMSAIRKALKKISFEELLPIVEEYAKRISWQEMKYIPNPDVWFDNEKWLDDQSTWDNVQSNAEQEWELPKDQIPPEMRA